MRYLLDTHALIWLARDERSRFSSRVAVIIDSDPASVYVSAASAWEMATKSRIGKLPGVEAFLTTFELSIHAAGFSSLSMTVRHSLLAGKLEGQHKDPFARFLAAQALIEGFILLSNDQELDAFGAQRIW